MNLFQKRFLFPFVALPLLYVASCTYTNWIRDRAFETVGMGDNERTVVRKFGEPSQRTPCGQTFGRYDSSGCQTSNGVRLWYENRLMLDIVAWSIDLDKEGNVTGKYAWSSP